MTVFAHRTDLNPRLRVNEIIARRRGDTPVSFTSFTRRVDGNVNEIIARRRGDTRARSRRSHGLREGTCGRAPARPPARLNSLCISQKRVNDVNERGVPRRCTAKISFTRTGICVCTSVNETGLVCTRQTVATRTGGDCR